MELKGKGTSYSIAVVIMHLLGIIMLFVGARSQPSLLGMGLLAYTLGMRHGFDVDHIVAIDNTVRKLVQQKKNPYGVGFYFSLGHSTVVFLMTIATVMMVRWVQQELPQMQEVGGLIGTMVSGSFLLFIGLLNLYIWFDIYKMFVRMRRGEYDDKKIESLLLSRGFIARFVGPLYQLINKSWHIYPLGFLFGLGFDTATEIAMLAMSATIANDTGLLGILALPILFASGMSLIDTIDGILMTNAYRWAYNDSLRRVYYNLTVTGMSVLAALFIGTLEVAQVIAPKLGLNNGFWLWIQNIDFSNIGYLLVAVFMLVWGISFGTWKFKMDK